jgi:hypothetical protein
MVTNDKRLTVKYRLADSSLQPKIDDLRDRYGMELIPAGAFSQEENLPLLRVTKRQLIIEHQGSNLFFHPSMALLRMINIKRGMTDRFLQAAGLTSGETLLDATMGLASDALIAAWAVGKKGKVVAVEGSVLLYLLVAEGLGNFGELIPAKAGKSDKLQAWEELIEASGRIETVYADHFSYLQALPDRSVDVVYFDPMFRDTLANSSPSIKPVKDLSVPEPLSEAAVEQACRAARRRVVLKERKGSGEFERLGFHILGGGKYSNICFGIIDIAH